MGFGPVRVTQGGFRKSTCDLEEVSAVGCGVCGALVVLRQDADNLRWSNEPWRSVGGGFEIQTSASVRG